MNRLVVDALRHNLVPRGVGYLRSREPLLGLRGAVSAITVTLNPAMTTIDRPVMCVHRVGRASE
jgi:hypothetical protein